MLKKRDPLSKAGAQDIARKIRAYWARRGVELSPEIVQEPDPTCKREYIYVVRSGIKFGAAR